LAGTCEVIKPLADDDDGEQLALAVLQPYSIFGEMSFFHKAPHSASVRAQTPVELLCIPRGDYDDLIQDGARGAYKLAFNAVASLAERLRRMDEWVAELSRHQPQAMPMPESRPSEWAHFRDRMFASWNL
jgi:CRP/FNR family transcriptional regulator, cyclic AMP receptor protein